MYNNWDTLEEKPQKKRINWGRLLCSAVLIVLVLALFAYAGYRYVMEPNEGEEPRGSASASESEEDLPRRMNILLIGTDSRGNEKYGRADAIMVAFVDFDQKKADVLSIPRDTRVDIPGRRNKDKINAAHAYGGVPKLTETVEELLKVPIDHYIKTDFDGFVEMIDIIGGVEINVERKMYKPEEDINIKPGPQTLDGYDALGYVRFRDYPMADIERVEVQQNFLKALLDQMLQIRNVWKIPELARALNENMETDLFLKDMAQVGMILKNSNKGSLTTYTLPGYTIDGLSFWIPKKQEIKDLLKEILRDKKTPAETEREQY